VAGFFLFFRVRPNTSQPRTPAKSARDDGSGAGVMLPLELLYKAA